MTDRRQLSDCISVIISEFATRRHYAVVVLLGEHQCTVYEVTEYGYELVVVACLVVLPGEVVILGSAIG